MTTTEPLRLQPPTPAPLARLADRLDDRGLSELVIGLQAVATQILERARDAARTPLAPQVDREDRHYQRAQWLGHVEGLCDGGRHLGAIAQQLSEQLADR